MGTRSAIGKVEADGKVQTIYCHFDGYPSHVGRILLEHYQSPEKVEQLIKLGALSTLGPEIGDKVDWNASVFDKQCRAYHRDRGEEWDSNKPIKFDGGTESFFTQDWTHQMWADFAYCYTQDGWFGCPTSCSDFPQMRAIPLATLVDAWDEWEQKDEQPNSFTAFLNKRTQVSQE